MYLFNFFSFTTFSFCFPPLFLIWWWSRFWSELLGEIQGNENGAVTIKKFRQKTLVTKTKT